MVTIRLGVNTALVLLLEEAWALLIASKITLEHLSFLPLISLNNIGWIIFLTSPLSD